MAHPTTTKMYKGRLWHLEDSGLSLVAAESLKQHLRKTEEKKAMTRKGMDGKWEVWWSVK